MHFTGVILDPVATDKTDISLRILGTIISLCFGDSYLLIKCGVLVAFFVNESLRIKRFNLLESNSTKNVLYGYIS